MLHIVDDLYLYNDWANAKIFKLCEGLTDEQLDEPRSMGFGSLRATLFHILIADQVWLERWLGKPWRTFPTGPDGITLDEIQTQLVTAAEQRSLIIDAHREEHWQNIVRFEDSKQTAFERPLLGLLLHVANHGIHHRAQALSFLKSFGRTVPAGIDYLFYRLSRTTVEQTPKTIETYTRFGLDVATTSGEDIDWDSSVIRLLYLYHDWANGKVIEMANDLSDAQLDHDFDMGPGSIRSTLLHLSDVETWWLNNWTKGPTAFQRAPSDTSVAAWKESYVAIQEGRMAYIASIDAQEAQRVVPMEVAGVECRFRVIESLVQLIGHGTHHRAQLINMIRNSGASVSNIDLMYAPSELA